MSEFDLKLSWTEESNAQGPKGPQGDHLQLQSEEPETSSNQLVARDDSAPANLDGSDELEELDPEPDLSEWNLEEFEYSDAREAAIEAALGKIQGQVRAPVVAYLRNLLEERSQLTPLELSSRLDTCEAWLQTQLHQWAPQKTVVPEEPTQDLQERTELFNTSVSCGSDALNLALEVVSLIRDGQPELAAKLLPQIESFLSQALEALDQVF